MYSVNIEFFGYFAAIMTTAAFLPQLIKTLKTKKLMMSLFNFDNVFMRSRILDHLRVCNIIISNPNGKYNYFNIEFSNTYFKNLFWKKILDSDC